MYVLLSSAATPRYRQDVLRCLAAPVSANVQFRYAHEHIALNVLQQMRDWNGRQAFGDAIVCFADRTIAPGRTLPLYPVRRVSIEAVNVHGTTASLILKMGDLGLAETAPFTEQVAAAAGNSAARKTILPDYPEGKVEGHFCFLIPDTPVSLTFGRTLTQWEQVVRRIQPAPAFADEPFFWTILGLQNPSETVVRSDGFEAWNAELPCSLTRNLLIYHFRPQGGDVPAATLSVTAGGALEGGSPPDLEIDSHYDLKRWLFKTQQSDWVSHYGWLRIRTNNTWNLDLPVTVRHQWVRMLSMAALAGAFIAGPSVIGILDKNQGALDGKSVLAIALSFVAGWIAAALVLANQLRLRS